MVLGLLGKARKEIEFKVRQRCADCGLFGHVSTLVGKVRWVPYSLQFVS